ncbi:MAG: cell division protein SepF, partial [Actinomycetota bacterium]|nr:cell division protein SepF [Actinomycetota bacterium]
MTTFFKKAMLYLGLGSDEDFLGMDPQVPNEQPTKGGVIVKPTTEGNSNVKPISGDTGSVRLGREAVTVTTAKPRKFVKPHIVTPIRFAEVKEISEAARRSQPVIVNLQQAEHDVAVRIIDFCSGLKMGIDGAFEKAGSDVFLLTPKDVEVSEDEK